MRSCTSRPTGLSASAVTILVSIPKQRRRPRATLYSPPPSQTWKLRAVWMRPSPGSSRSITSPRLTRSQRHLSLGLILRLTCLWHRPQSVIGGSKHWFGSGYCPTEAGGSPLLNNHDFLSQEIFPNRREDVD